MPRPRKPKKPPQRHQFGVLRVPKGARVTDWRGVEANEFEKSDDRPESRKTWEDWEFD